MIRLALIVVMMNLCHVSYQEMSNIVDILDCTDNISKSELVFEENKPFSICCHLVDQELCSATTLNDSLTILPDRGDNISFNYTVSRIDSCMVKLEVENASLKEGTWYSCTLNGVQYRREKVDIIEKPDTPVIKRFVCTAVKKITVAFEPNIHNKQYTDFYEIIMYENLTKRRVILCQKNATSNFCKDSQHNCTCTYADNNNDRSEYNYPETQKVTITVIVYRAVVSVKTEKVFSVMENIQPGPVRRIGVVDIGAHDAYIQFCTDINTCNILGLMTEPLWFNIMVYTKQEFPQILKMTLSSDGSCCIRQLHLPLLTPFTKYTAVISASSGGGESENTEKEFETKMTVPLLPPVLEDFSFSRFLAKDTSKLVLLWQALPHSVQGGNDLSYIVSVTSESGFFDSTTVTESYAVIINQNLPTDPLTVKIWAHNGVGHSENHTTLEIPARADVNAPEVYAELHGDSVSVYVDLNDSNNIRLLAIHTCRTYRYVGGLEICQDYPQTTYFNITERNHYEVHLNQMEKQPPEMTEMRHTTYFHADKLNDSLNKPVNATLIVITWPRKFEDYDFIEDDFRPENDDYYYYYNDSYNLREKRSFGTLNQSFVEDDNEIHSLLRIFISMKTEEELWQYSMIPAKCYFDRAKDEASVSFRFTEDESGKPSLSLKSADCDHHEPLHFMAEYFLAYSSTDKDCNILENGTLLGNVSNGIFHENTISLDEPVNCACVEAYRSGMRGEPPMSCQKPSVVDHRDTAAIETLPPRIIAAIVTPAICLILLGGICKCIRRKRHFRNLKGLTGFQLPDKPAKHASANEKEAAPEVPERESINNFTVTKGTESYPLDNNQINYIMQANLTDASSGTSDHLGVSTGTSSETVDSLIQTNSSEVSYRMLRTESTEEERSDEEVDQQQALKKCGLVFNSNITESV